MSICLYHQHLDQLVCVFAMCSGIPTSLPVYQKIQYTFVKLDTQGWVVSVATWPLHVFHYTRMFSPDVLIWMFKICTHLALSTS